MVAVAVEAVALSPLSRLLVTRKRRGAGVCWSWSDKAYMRLWYMGHLRPADEAPLCEIMKSRPNGQIFDGLEHAEHGFSRLGRSQAIAELVHRSKAKYYSYTVKMTFYYAALQNSTGQATEPMKRHQTPTTLDAPREIPRGSALQPRLDFIAPPQGRFQNP